MLDDRDLWLLQVEIDVYTLLKKVSGRCVDSLYRDLWLLQAETEVCTLLKKVRGVEKWTVCTLHASGECIHTLP